MKKSTEKFLEFNGKSISFLSVDGQWWVALRPILEALNVDYIQQFKNVKNDIILSQLLCEHTTVAADGKLRKMICLPERYIYGWLFSITSGSEELIEFKRECYDVLFNHFHGGFRGELQIEKLKNHARIEYLQRKVNEQLESDPNFKEINELMAKNIKIGQQISKLDKETEKNQLDMFRATFEEN